MVTVKHNSTAPLGGGAKISTDQWNADHTVDGLGGAAELDVGTTAGTVAAGDHGHDAATTSDPGFMAAADKTKLDATPAFTLSASEPSGGANGDWWGVFE